ncbi:hypothetical protein PV413_19670 [Streptomyces scabiei]|uniref:hypothetical protein n=1 Tax=Streptomyces scabiei TaxID=1930 RepID=UPI0029BE3CA9|nr:hypothetical protein [Streptomyces scabiei]MDX2566069.1 hypothetical protein [Streptomyces scabiei]MDX3149651.1 hypothetical protein [Streptomyces scabiei]MDX3161749.1 hypothetical protein [Streptomyces scabiei]MDX3288109.1 hypothetical protein [Streptomyces scabiei]
MTDKPPVPATMFDPWPRIPIDTSGTSPLDRILRIAAYAADDWTLGPDGPFKQRMTPATICRLQIREGLLHLLELGLIDIDTDRIDQAPGIPCRRAEG